MQGKEDFVILTQSHSTLIWIKNIMDTQIIINYSKRLFKEYDEYRVGTFQRRSFLPETLQNTLDELTEDSSGFLQSRTIGKSFEDRNIRLIKVGRGKISILLWSQMHGDESTATMAICDILNYLKKTTSEKTTEEILSSLELFFVPMLNPDGAARFQRRTAQGIDMNRDALSLVTPEARVLKSIREELKPKFGFNLHDQELSTVGSTKDIAAIGLLSPSLDHEKKDNDVRTRSKHLASVFAQTMDRFIPGRITRYDDSFEPRAFGDNMQRWGTSTLLVESGHSLNDPEKDFIRKLNFVGILTTLYAIATNVYNEFEIPSYESLPFNGKRAYDVVIRNIFAEHPNGMRSPVDLGISYQVDTHSELPPKLIDIGDLHTFVGLREIDAKGKIIPQSSLMLNQTFEWEKYFL
jgi:hypothetical protein